MIGTIKHHQSPSIEEVEDEDAHPKSTPPRNPHCTLESDEDDDETPVLPLCLVLISTRWIMIRSATVATSFFAFGPNCLLCYASSLFCVPPCFSTSIWNRSVAVISESLQSSCRSAQSTASPVNPGRVCRASNRLMVNPQTPHFSNALKNTHKYWCMILDIRQVYQG